MNSIKNTKNWRIPSETIEQVEPIIIIEDSLGLKPPKVVNQIKKSALENDKE